MFTAAPYIMYTHTENIVKQLARFTICRISPLFVTRIESISVSGQYDIL